MKIKTKGGCQNMRSTGIVRKVDELGRVVIPIELRRTLNISEKDQLEIFMHEDKVVLSKFQYADIFTGGTEELVDYKGKKVSVQTIKELAALIGIKID